MSVWNTPSIARVRESEGANAQMVRIRQVGGIGMPSSSSRQGGLRGTNMGSFRGGDHAGFCRYFLRGECTKGVSCRFSHGPGSSSTAIYATSNRSGHGDSRGRSEADTYSSRDGHRQGRSQRTPNQRYFRPDPMSDTSAARGLLEAWRCVPTDDRPHLMLVLVGLPGSGKSTFASQIQATVCDPERWAAPNQDVLGDRHAVVAAASRHLGLLSKEAIPAALNAGWRGIIIDRCNFDRNQRAHWLQLAGQTEEVTGRPTLSICVMMPHADDVSFCIQRAVDRGDDGVHRGDEDWPMIVSRMSKTFVAGHTFEGFAGVYWANDFEALDEITGLLSNA